MLKSGELARLCGVSTDTLRHYERVGVLPRAARTASGYRQYPPEAQVRVMAVRRALALGARFSPSGTSGSPRRPKGRVLDFSKG